MELSCPNCTTRVTIEVPKAKLLKEYLRKKKIVCGHCACVIDGLRFDIALAKPVHKIR